MPTVTATTIRARCCYASKGFPGDRLFAEIVVNRMTLILLGVSASILGITDSFCSLYISLPQLQPVLARLAPDFLDDTGFNRT